MTFSKLACLFSGHRWPEAHGACQWRQELDLMGPMHKDDFYYRAVGWGVCARCGTPWYMKGIALFTPSKREIIPDPYLPMSWEQRRQEREATH